jgi:hypothetical protein
MNVNTFRYILINNKTSASRVITVGPADWAETTHRHFRSVRYGTMLREDTLSLRFVLTGGAADNGGYYFLLDAYEADGIYADVTCKRQRLNRSTNAYEERFIGKVDFSEESGWSFQEEWAEFKLIDSGKLAKFISRDEIDVNVFETTSLDGVAITPFSNPYREITAPKVDIPLILESSMGLFSAIGTATPSPGDKYFFNQKNIIINELRDRVDVETGVETIYTNSTSSDAVIDLTLLALRSVQTVVYTPTHVPNSVQYNTYYIFSSYDKDSVLIDQHIVPIVSDIIGNISTPETRNYNETISESNLASLSVPQGGRMDAVFLVFIVEGFIQVDYNITNSSIELYFIETTLGWPDNQIRGLFANEMALRFIQLYTSETDTSKLLQADIMGKTDSEFNPYVSTGYFGNEFIFNGYQARQFINRAINGNFADFFKTLTTDKPIGLWFNKTADYFEIKPIEDYYKLEAFPIHLGEVKNFKRYPAKDYYFSNIKTGYPKTDNEDFQGVNEFNTETEHNSKTETKNTKDLRSRWRRSTIDIELLRRKNISKYASEDTKNDNNNYIVSTNGTTITQGELSGALGIINIAQYYNQLKTPRQNLKRQLIVYATTLYKSSAKFLRFGKSSKDTNIEYTDPTSGITVNEFDEIQDSEFVEPLVWPEILEFEGLYTNDIEEEMSLDPHRYYRLTALGQEWFGYGDEISGTPYQGKATYKLMRLNENRLP